MEFSCTVNPQAWTALSYCQLFHCIKEGQNSEWKLLSCCDSRAKSAGMESYSISAMLGKVVVCQSGAPRTGKPCSNGSSHSVCDASAPKQLSLSLKRQMQSSYEFMRKLKFCKKLMAKSCFNYSPTRWLHLNQNILNKMYGCWRLECCSS